MSSGFDAEGRDITRHKAALAWHLAAENFPRSEIWIKVGGPQARCQHLVLSSIQVFVSSAAQYT